MLKRHIQVWRSEEASQLQMKIRRSWANRWQLTSSPIGNCKLRRFWHGEPHGTAAFNGPGIGQAAGENQGVCERNRMDGGGDRGQLRACSCFQRTLELRERKRMKIQKTRRIVYVLRHHREGRKGWSPSTKQKGGYGKENRCVFLSNRSE